MSDVAFYQITIIVSILLAGVAIGPRFTFAVAAAWAIWTMAMVFTRWLYLLQFGTIAVSVFATFVALESARLPVLRRYLRRAAAFGFAACGLVLGLFLFDSYKNGVTTAIQSGQRSTTQELSLVPRHDVPAKPIENGTLNDDLFSRMVDKVERDIPVLNPRSPYFNKLDVDQVGSTMRAYVSSGMPPHLALERAANEFKTNASPPGKQIFKCGPNADQKIPTYQDFPCDGRR